MKKLVLLLFLITELTFVSCKTSSKETQIKKENSNDKSKTTQVDSLIRYQTENLIIRKLSNHVYEHTSFLDTDDYGKVGCNGMLVVNENKGIIFDTPTDNKSSLELLNFVANELKSEVIAVIPTHFHKDCVGGIQVFEEQNIPTYATKQTIELLKGSGQRFAKSIKEFKDNLTLSIGNKKVYAEYFGEGHTKDNIIGYFPEDAALFGGCLIKKIDASKGYLGDANTNEWSETVRKIKMKFPNVNIVIPGHGKWGGNELFDYTIALFE